MFRKTYDVIVKASIYLTDHLQLNVRIVVAARLRLLLLLDCHCGELSTKNRKRLK